MDNLYTEDEAAAFPKIEVRALARLRRAGRIGAIRVTPRRYLYTEAHLQDYLASHVLPVSRSPVEHVIQPHAGPATEVQSPTAQDHDKPSSKRARKAVEPAGRVSNHLRVAMPEFGESSFRKPPPRKR